MGNTAIPTRKNSLEVAVGLESTMTKVAGLTNISLSINNEKEQYYTYDSIWQDTVVTGKSLQISFEGKRYKDDPAQNALVACVDKDGDEATIKATYKSASDGTYTGTFAVEITEFAGGGEPNSTGNIKGVLYLKGQPEHSPAAG